MTIKKSLMQDFKAILKVLKNAKYAALLLLTTSFFWLGYAVLTDILLIAPFELNPELDYANTALILLAGFLTALIVTITVYSFKQGLGLISGKKTGFLGSVLGVFATACPVCQPIWLVWLGLGNASLFLVEFSTYIALASVGILLFSLHLAAQAVDSKTCKF